MTYSFDIRKDGDVLCVCAQGERSYDSVVAISTEIMAACEKEDTRRALIDVRELKGSLNPWQIFKFVTAHFAEIKNLRVLSKVAIVDVVENRERTRFFETMADNRGYNLRMFEDAEQAAAWLAEGYVRKGD